MSVPTARMLRCPTRGHLLATIDLTDTGWQLVPVSVPVYDGTERQRSHVSRHGADLDAEVLYEGEPYGPDVYRGVS